MSNDLTPLFELYDKLFNFFNAQYYNNELPLPVFMTDPSYRDTSKTNFVKFKVWTIKGEARYEGVELASTRHKQSSPRSGRSICSVGLPGRQSVWAELAQCQQRKPWNPVNSPPSHRSQW